MNYNKLEKYMYTILDELTEINKVSNSLFKADKAHIQLHTHNCMKVLAEVNDLLYSESMEESAHKLFNMDGGNSNV